jgi:ubiquinone/menaquinone biosynthesis C-methylase UbiE
MQGTRSVAETTEKAAARSTQISGEEFSQVDAQADKSAFVRYLDSLGNRLRAHKRAGHALLALKPGDTVLDVGCGVGIDVFELEALVGPTGRAVGVDSSAAMVEEARKRAAQTGSRAEFRVAGGESLPFADATFDAVRTERVLMHADDAGAVIREMARVAKPGGRVWALEPDHQMSAIDSMDGDLADRVFRTLVRSRSPRAGRQLRGHFLAAGLADVDMRVLPYVISTWAEFRSISGFAVDPEATLRKVVDGGIASEAGMRAMFADLDARDREGRFWACLMVMRCQGVRPK